ncbi:MAG: hypothetical protein EBS01_06945 [Verrucomicrobia bacterium]|nr:hypothetical protein [Verrucomicrobiota bacterium]
MTPLQTQFLNRIREKGSLSFAEFMEEALYDPQHGYYASGKARIGRDGCASGVQGTDTPHPTGKARIGRDGCASGCRGQTLRIPLHHHGERKPDQLLAA